MTVLITGASSGIGYALTLHYLKNGCSVAATLGAKPNCRLFIKNRNAVMGI
ncbi:MAG: SDR family NAD(P)-dependent oxidoreductase [Pseudanabaena sp. SU_2_4]|nr:SDR family NAD(P)-dependent oxidoreductase [Pseudanabaena sp. SU_2_4]